MATTTTSVCFFPVVTDEEQLVDLLSRAAWFLSFCPIDRIHLPIASASLLNVPWRVAPGMDGRIAENFGELRRKLVFVVATAASDLDACMAGSGMILRWKEKEVPSFVGRQRLAEWEQGKRIFQVDSVAIRHEGSYYIDVGFALMQDRAGVIEDNKRKFGLLAQHLGKFRHAFLMATGPSVSNFRYLEYRDALTIVCNSVILDETLMEAAQPKILVFADPIFHFGPSQYAGAFRRKLQESAQKHDFTICIPLKYYPLFTAAMPELAERTIGIPFVKERPWNFDLAQDFCLKTTANILTFLMVPLAATFAGEIAFLGCNGRPLSEDTYFWNHNPNTQFNDKMANIREVHPGFFAIDYNDYYLEHCNTLEQQLQEGERQGKKFSSLGFSHIPALNGRMETGRKIAGFLDGKPKSKAVLISRTGPETDAADGRGLLELSKALAGYAVEVRPIRCPDGADSSFLQRVQQEIVDTDFADTECLVYVHHLPLPIVKLLAPLTAIHPGLRLHVALAGVPDEIGGESLAESAEFLGWLANGGPRVAATVANRETMAKLAELSGHILPVEPSIPAAEGGQATDGRRLAEMLFGSRPVVRGYPRLAVVDLTNMGGFAATSRVKEAFFGTWPGDKFRLVCVDGGGAGKRLVLADKQGKKLVADAGNDEVMAAIAGYAPEVVYYRAVDDREVHDFATRLTAKLAVPFAVHMMDDWPARLKANQPAEFAHFDRSLREMLRAAHARLSIGQKMSAAFKDRYGLDFLPFANAVDPASFPPRPDRQPADRPFLIRYTGALAEDMTFASIREVAEAVEALSAELNIRLEIYTRWIWKDQARQIFAGMNSVAVFDQVPAEDYTLLLAGADALLIAYNFDAASQAYVGFSMANKLPEYLASGVPVIVYGPAEAATIRHARERECVQLVDRQDPEALREKIRSLAQSPELQARLGKAGRDTAFLHHNVWKVASDLHALLIGMAGGPVLLGPYAREDSAHWDETECIAHLYANQPCGRVMVDVGAHQGTALMPFLNMEWRIFAFEPDEKNRAILVQRLAQHAHGHQVKLDLRAVSNESKSGLSFYRSEESTGISGLSAFHPSHRAEQTVDTVTLSAALADAAIAEVSFLKVDTEGHDLFVLQGFPWDRFKPAVIECEFEDTKTVPLGYTYRDMANYLLDKGYTVYLSEWHPIQRYGIRHDWNRLLRYPCELADPKGWGNLLAFREPVQEARLIDAVRAVLKLNKPADSAPVLPAAKTGPVPPKKVVDLFAAPPVKKAEESSPSSCLLDPVRASDPARFARKVWSPHFKLLKDHLWRYEKPQTSAQSLWLAVFDIADPATSGWVGGLRVQANRAMQIQVSLARFGETPYEDARKTLALEPKVAQTVVLDKLFLHRHASLKLQLEILEMPGEEAAELVIDRIFLTESMAGARQRLGEGPVDLKTANRLFREGDYTAAMSYYLHLAELRPLSAYEYNALLSARRLGWRGVANLDDLRKRLAL